MRRKDGKGGREMNRRDIEVRRDGRGEGQG